MKKCLLLLLLLQSSSCLQAQEYSEYTATTKELAPVATPETIQEIEALFERGAYDDTINQSTPYLQTPKTSEPRLLFCRGIAAYNIGAFGMAEGDLSQISDFRSERNGEYASDYLQKIAQLKALVPKRIYEVRKGCNVVFRVYYDNQDDWSFAIIKLLPKTYKVNYDLLTKDASQTPIFIFGDYNRFKKFFAIRRSGSAPGSWIWASGGIDGFEFCSNHPTNTRSRDSSSAYVQGTVAHEFNHCMVRRLLGGADVPTWLMEGLATSIEPEIAPSRLQNFSERMEDVMQSNALLSMRDISYGYSFNQSVERNDSSDAYVQSYSMVKYLISRITPKNLTPFLEEIRTSRSYETALLKFTGQSPDEFYAACRDGLQAAK